MDNWGGEKRHLGKYVRIPWAFRGTGVIIFMAGLIYVLFSSIVSSSLWITREQIPFYVACGAGLALIAYFSYTELRYRNYFYALAENELIVRSGILHTHRVTVPYAKIQNLTFRRTLFQRIFGSAKLVIGSAARNTVQAEAVLPAVADFETVMADIKKKMEGAKESGGTRKF